MIDGSRYTDVSRVLLALALATLAPLGSLRAEEIASADTVRNERMDLVVETASDLSSVAVTATFYFQTSSVAPDLVWFQFPGVDRTVSFSRLELNGRTLRPEELHLDTGGDVPHFVLDRSLLYRVGSNRLVVAGPSTSHSGADFTHWGSWHPYLGSRATPVAISLEVRTGDAFQVVSSGRLVSESTRSGRRSVHWHTVVPQGWVFLSIGEYRSAELAQGPVSMTVHWPRSHKEFVPDSIGRIPFDILRFFRDRFGGGGGAAGRSHFALIEIPSDEVENLSVDGLVVISRGSHRMILQNPSYLEAVLSHELAHYWWGDIVTPVGPGARWLTEGFAEYSRDLYERETGGERIPWSYRNLIVLKRFVNQEPPPLTASVGRDDGEEVYYQKGAFVLHMLESEIGSPRLRETMRTFVQERRGRTATVNDFITAVDVASKTSSAWFFDQWLRRPTGPVLRLALLGLDQRSDSIVVHMTIEQDVPAYRLLLPIVAYYANGDSAVRMVRLDSARTALDLRYATRPERLVLDPGGDVFKWFPAAAMPLDFTKANQMLHDAPCISAEGADDASVMDSLVRFVGRRFRREVSADRQCPVTILVGGAAAQFRERFAPSVPSAQPGSITAFVWRPPGDSDRVVIGVEGALAAGWPDALIPEAPLTFIALRGGQVIAAHSAGLPRLEVRLAGH
jgi:hypothetical protein